MNIKEGIVIGALGLSVLSGCKPLEEVQQLAPGESIKLRDIRYDDYALSCELTYDDRADYDTIFVHDDPHHELFLDALGDIEAAREKYTLRRVVFIGRPVRITNDYIELEMWDRFDWDGVRKDQPISVHAEFLNGKALNEQNRPEVITISGRIVFIERWHRLRLDQVEILGQW